MKAKELDLDRMIMGTIVEPSEEKGKVRIKFLAIAGGCGPNFSMDRSLAVQLHTLLGKFLETGDRQESVDECWGEWVPPERRR